jgi:hypothetical protein
VSEALFRAEPQARWPRRRTAHTSAGDELEQRPRWLAGRADGRPTRAVERMDFERFATCSILWGLTFDVRGTRRRRRCSRSEQSCPAVVCPLDGRVRPLWAWHGH